MKLRPHHGMCLAFFEGKGYSKGFTAHMAQVKQLLSEEDPPVFLVPETDEICSCCPNTWKGVCTAADKVERYDREVLSCCGLSAGAELPWSTFSALVHEHILAADRRREICAGCQWNDICTGQEKHMER